MIYLIGGPPKCGKTTLAKMMSKSLGIPWVSTDTLQSVIKPYLSKEDLTNKFPVNNQRCDSNDEKYSKYSTGEIIQAYQRQANTVCQAIEMFALCEITDGNNFIIEGYHVEPSLVVDLSKKYPDKIKSIFLIKLDREKFIRDIMKSSTPNDWIITRTNNGETYQKIAEMICEYGEYFNNEAEKSKLKALNMDDEFDLKIESAIRLLL